MTRKELRTAESEWRATRPTPIRAPKPVSAPVRWWQFWRWRV